MVILESDTCGIVKSVDLTYLCWFVDPRDLIQPILEKEYVKLEELRHDEDLSPKQIQRKVEEMRSDTASKIKTILTPEQQKKVRVGQ